MALKTGYKVNGKEIILDNYSKYTSDKDLRVVVQTQCNKTLENWYKGHYKIEYADGETVETNEISASHYVEGTGQVLAELPGDNCYKTPSGIEAPKFALYGTNTAGGWINEAESPHWVKYTGNTDSNYTRVITISFDGSNLTATEDGNVTHLRGYVLDDGTPLALDVIKFWCYVVGAGGGGSTYDGTNHIASGGGGGGAGVLCFKLFKGHSITVHIPPATNGGSSGTSTLIYYDKDLKFIGYPGANGDKDTGGKGGDSYTPEIDDKLISCVTRSGGSGNGYTGSSVSTIDIKADYFPIYEKKSNKGGQGYHEPTTTTGLYRNKGGGGASGFPNGIGGYIIGLEEGYISPGSGGGGAGYSSYFPNCAKGGPGAFWILVA